MPQKKYGIKFFSVILFLFIPLFGHALPIDWQGKFGVDTTIVTNYRKAAEESTIASPGNSNSQIVADAGSSEASFQSYLLSLKPIIIVNDASTLKAELSTGYGRGGRIGENGQQNGEKDASSDFAGNMGGALYNINTTTEKDLNINQLYLELFADTATYIIGRHKAHWALGAVINDGENLWDRHFYSRDGVTIKMKVGNFYIDPFWARLSSGNKLISSSSTTEYGFSILYDNPENDLGFGLLYRKKVSGSSNTTLKSGISGTNNSLEEANVKLIDIYFKKAFGNLKLEVEVPIITGNVGKIFGSSSSADFNSKAILAELEYKYNNKWTFGANIGSVDGEDGNTDEFNAFYIHPNYQIANILFRYNFSAVNNGDTQSIYDSYITNTQFLKLYANYTMENWLWDFAFIYANAIETAKSGKAAYNHTTHRTFTAGNSLNQDSSMGIEIDVGFTYLWNNEIKIGSAIGYALPGKYFAFTNNSSDKVLLANSYSMQLNLGVAF